MADFMNPSADLQAGREAGWNDRQREIDDLLDQVAALEERLAAEEAANIPRPPKAEWFGTWPNQWDSWQVQMSPAAEWILVRGSDAYRKSRFLGALSVVPVARTGYPSSVGWHVVGEGSTP